MREAEDFVKHGHASRSSANKPPKFYGVASGRKIGVYDNWTAAQEQIKDWPRPICKSFPTRSEADQYVKSYDGTAQSNGIAKKQKTKGNEEDIDVDPVNHAAGEGPLPPGAVDGFDHTITLNPTTGKVDYKTDQQLNATKWRATCPVDDGLVKIYTDGSSLGNGRQGAVAGVGVYFGPRDKRYVPCIELAFQPETYAFLRHRNVSEALNGPRQTNQRAELTAIQRALEIAPRDRPVAIYTDSNYAIKCLTEWFHRWRANGWVNSQKKPVENKDIIERVLALLEEREKVGSRSEQDGGSGLVGGSDGQVVKGRARVQFIWVKGHSDDQGNAAADELAVAGAQDAKKGANGA